MTECKVERNKEWCSCTYESCAKKGVCCDCLKSHLQSGEFPACLFPPDVERTYDRSIERFIRTYEERGRWW
jgi:hypothetical protein